MLLRKCLLITSFIFVVGSIARADEPAAKQAIIDGVGDGWVTLGEKDFTLANCYEDTWTFKDGIIHCTGQPIGVHRSVKEYTNFEMVFEWQHLRKGGNSGCFVWTPLEAIEALDGPGLPRGGIEVQVLDVGYADLVKERNPNAKTDWFTSHGDIFPVGKSKLTPFPPLSPNGSRSFPSEDRVKPTGEWNEQEVTCIGSMVTVKLNGTVIMEADLKSVKPIGDSYVINYVNKAEKGHIGLLGHNSPVAVRKVRIKELP